MTDGAEDHEPSYLQKFSRQFSRHDSEFSGVGRQFSRHDSEFSHQIKNLLDDDHKQFNGTKIPDIILTEDDRLLENNQQTNNGGAGHMAIDMTRENSRDSNASFATFQSGGDLYKLSEYAKKHSIMMRVPEDTEGALTLVGALDIIDEPLTAFVRLEEGIIMPNALEIPLPMRFIFLLLTPKNSSFIDGHEVGRSFSALMSNRKFHNVCYGIEGRKELLTAINDFLDSSVVLPPGDWDSKNLLSMDEINELRNRKRGRKSKDMSTSSVSERKKENRRKSESFQTNPLVRSPHLFGGLVNDIKQRSKWYWSDIKDGFSSQVFAAAVFIYFAR